MTIAHPYPKCNRILVYQCTEKEKSSINNNIVLSKKEYLKRIPVTLPEYNVNVLCSYMYTYPFYTFILGTSYRKCKSLVYMYIYV